MLTTTFRLSLVLAFAAALTLAGLSRPRVADAQAVTTTTNTQAPFTPALFVPCANGGVGELVQFSGEVHVLSHTTVNGDHRVTKSHVQPHGVIGVGLTTGDTYHAAGGGQTVSSFWADGAPSTLAIINITRFIGPGPGNNLLIRSTLHLTINSNGEVTSSQSDFSFECK